MRNSLFLATAVALALVGCGSDGGDSAESDSAGPTQEDLAAGAKGLAVMKEGHIPSKDGTALVGEGMRQGYRPSELLDLGREVKRRGADFEEGRASLQQLREQVSRGERNSLNKGESV